MSNPPREERRLVAIRSVSLEDIVLERHTWWRRLMRQKRLLIGVVSLLGLTAAAGSAAYHVLSGSGTPGENGPLVVGAVAPAHTGSLPPSPGTLPKPRPNVAAPEIAAPAAPDAPEAVAAPEPVRMARVPRPRPDEPIVTGSIAPSRDASPHPRGPRYAAHPRQRQVARAQDPCRRLQAMTAHLPVTVYCPEDRRHYRPPPHARYVPGPPYVRW